MKRKLIIWARRGLLAALGLFCLALLGGNIWLNTAGGKGRILARVAGYAPGEPVSAGMVTFFPWSGLTVNRLCLGERFSARQVRARANLATLLTRKIEIDEVRFIEPVFTVRPARQAAGVIARSDHAPPVPPLPEGVRPTPAPLPTVPPEVTAKPAVPTPVRRMVFVLHAAMEGGRLVLTDAEGNERLVASDLSLEMDLTDPRIVTGTVGAALLALDGVPVVTNGTATLEMAGDFIRLGDLSGDCRGGKIGGAVAIRLRQPGVPFQLELNADSVDAVSLLAERFGREMPVQLVEGKLSGKIRSQGYLRALRDSIADVSLSLDDGRLRIPEGYRAAQGLDIGEDGSVRMERASLRGVVAGRQFVLRDATARSGDTVLKSVGAMTFAGDLNLSSRLYVGESMRRSLAARLPDLGFQDLDGCGLFFRDFLVGGNVRSAASDFLNRGQMRPAGEVLHRLQRIAGEGRGSERPVVDVTVSLPVGAEH